MRSAEELWTLRTLSLRPHEGFEQRLPRSKTAIRPIKRSLIAYLSLVGHVARLHHIRLLLKIATYVDQRICKTGSGGRESSFHFILHTNLVVSDVIVDAGNNFLRYVGAVVNTGRGLEELWLSHPVLRLDLRVM
jgi:hypothetical protein